MPENGMWRNDDGHIAVGKCPNCGYIYGDDLDYRFPEPSKCDGCGEELENTTVADEETVRDLADGKLPGDRHE